jgi:hypothetical protein
MLHGSCCGHVLKRAFLTIKIYVLDSAHGDINARRTVDIYDTILPSDAYNIVPGSPKWNPNADLKADDVMTSMVP